MKIEASITYNVTTHESAESGDYAEHGWWMPGGWEYALHDADGQHQDILDRGKAGEFDLPLSEALRVARNLGATHEVEISGCSVTSRSIDPPYDKAYHERGESRYYTLHIDAGTPLRARLIANAIRKGLS